MHVVWHYLFCKQVDVMSLANPIKSLVCNIFCFFPLKHGKPCFGYQNNIIPILPNTMGKPFYFKAHTIHFAPHMRFSQSKNVYELILSPNSLCKNLKRSLEEKDTAFSLFALKSEPVSHS